MYFSNINLNKLDIVSYENTSYFVNKQCTKYFWILSNQIST